jgi:hypothetical protein
MAQVNYCDMIRRQLIVTCTASKSDFESGKSRVIPYCLNKSKEGSLMVVISNSYLWGETRVCFSLELCKPCPPTPSPFLNPVLTPIFARDVRAI